MAIRTVAFTAVLLGALTALGCSSKESASHSTTTVTDPPGSVTTTTEVPLEAGKQLFVYTPVVGDCFDRRRIPGQNGKSTDITLKLDCAVPHHFEVFGIVEYPLGGPKIKTPTATATGTATSTTAAATAFPGDDELRHFAKLECPKLFKEYVGIGFETSTYDMTYLLPQSATWPSVRKLACLLSESNTERTLDRGARDAKR